MIRGSIVHFSAAYPEEGTRLVQGQIEDVYPDDGIVIVRDSSGEDWSVNIEDVQTS